MLSGFCSFYSTKVLLLFELTKCFDKKVQNESAFCCSWLKMAHWNSKTEEPRL